MENRPQNRQSSHFLQNRFSSLAIPLAVITLLGFAGCKTNDTPTAPPQAAAVPQRPATPAPVVRPQRPIFNSGPTKPVPYVSARACIVVDGRSGKVLYQKNADTRVPVASTQKLLLGLMMVEGGNLGKTIRVEASDTWAEPTVMGIKTGETYRKDHLLKAVLVRSSNDIARCLARDQYGSVSNFAAAATRRARALGMNNSYFTNASGLPDPPGQFSTARDLSILAGAAMRHAFIRDAVRTKSMTFRHADGRTRTLTNTNKVLKSFSYCTGAKTGYTNAAGRCLISTAENGGKSVTVVILGSKTPNVWTESDALLRWGLGM